MFRCKRSSDESYAVFVNRFKSIAQPHLDSFEHPRSGQEKQHIALVLLENAKLPDSIYENILTVIIKKISETSCPSPIHFNDKNQQIESAVCQHERLFHPEQDYF